MNVDADKWLQEFATHRSEAAFAALVRAHVDLVYSAARRIAAGDSHLAEDITQTVFADLARKAARLPAGVVLSGWLYRHTYFVASSMIRAERRRRTREQEVFAMNTVAEAPEPDWSRLAPHLDKAMNALAEADRLALVLRYFDRLDLRAVGERLGVGEDAAQKRVARALEKLKARFARDGIQVSLTTLAATLLANAVSAAPVVLAAHVAAAVASGAAVGSGILIALEKFMTLNALKPVAAALVLAGVATPLFLQHRSLAASRGQDANLGAQVAELDELRAENERLAKLAVDFRELERLRNEHLELMRLRGEATLLRNQLNELKREFERQRQLLAAKGAAEEELLTDEEREARRQIMIEARFAEVPIDSGIWSEFGLPIPNGLAATEVQILDSQPAKRLVERLELIEGVSLQGAPRVTMRNGMQTQMKSVDVRNIVIGRSGGNLVTKEMEFGPVLDLIATFEPGGHVIRLNANASANAFLGYGDPGDDPAQGAGTRPGVDANPRFRVRELKTEASVWDGQSLVLSGGYYIPEESKAESGSKPGQPMGMIVIIQPVEVRPQGFPAQPVPPGEGGFGGSAFSPSETQHPPGK